MPPFVEIRDIVPKPLTEEEIQEDLDKKRKLFENARQRRLSKFVCEDNFPF